MRFHLLDRVTELVVGERVRGIKNVTLTDEVLHDHFPDHPIMPGTLIVEGAAQMAGYLLEATCNEPGKPLVRALLVQIHEAKFYDMAGPGDQIALSAVLTSRHEGAAQVRIEGHVGERRILRGQLTFIMKAIDSERLHEQRRYIYRLWTRGLQPPPPIP